MANEDMSFVDIFATERPDDDENKVGDLLSKPEHVQEEEKLRKKNLEEQRKREAREAAEADDLTQEERYQKLTELLGKSKFYSQFLFQKLQTEDETTKKLKAEKLKDRKSTCLTPKPDDNGKKRKRPTRSSLDGAATSAKKARRAVREFNGEQIPEEQPLLLSGGIMRDYQIKGYAWMAKLYENGINGILADEMGLGKTIQTIALFCHLVEMGVSGPYLIVAPLSTIPNWVKEFNKFAPLLPVVLYHGANMKEREELRHKYLNRAPVEISEGFEEPRQARHIFVTSYEIAMNDRKHFQRISWRYIVVDEGHRLKNMNCRLIRELRLYKSSNRLLLTGTPLQNNLDELWSLLNFLMSEIFDDLRVFKSWFNATDMDIEGASESKRIIRQEQQNNILTTLHQILTPFLLRRVKADVDLKIPPKKEVLVYCPMTARQREFYEATVNRTIDELVDNKDVDSANVAAVADTEGRPKRSGPKFDYKTVFEHEDHESAANFDKYCEALKMATEARENRGLTSAYASACVHRTSEVRYSLKSRMMDLRKSTNHPYLIEYPLEDDGFHFRIDESLVDVSGKMKVLDQMLAELLSRGHKVLVFSQMTRMLDILMDFLGHRGLKYSRLDGSMDFMSRQENIDAFNERTDVNVFLLSTRAGGLGINLTAADTCIIYDSDWNPQQDLQAQDRCHRIGQTRPVMVYRLVTAKTIDERIVERASAKRRLEKLIIHHKKFKDVGEADVAASMEPISPLELLELLKSEDHAGVVDRTDQPVFSRDDLERLLDRSAMTTTPTTTTTTNGDKENNRKGGGKRRSSRRGAAGDNNSSQQQQPSSDKFMVVDAEGYAEPMLKSVVETD